MFFLIFKSEVISYGPEPIALNLKTFYVHSYFSASLKNQVKLMLLHVDSLQSVSD